MLYIDIFGVKFWLLLFIPFSDDNIKVYVRVRPPESYANEIDHKPCLEVTSRTSLTLFSKPDPKVFTYDQVADPNTTQVWATKSDQCVYTTRPSSGSTLPLISWLVLDRDKQ